MHRTLKVASSLLLISVSPFHLFGAHTPIEQIEHDLAMALADPTDATHTATVDGDWTNPVTWGGAAPGAGDRIHIPAGRSVTVDGIIADTFQTIRLDGTLNFATNVNTELKFDTLVGSMSSLLQVGTAGSPIQDSVTAKVIIEDIGGIEIADNLSPDYDPSRVGLGLILHGQVVMHGMKREGYASFISADATDTVIQLDRLPSDWAVGDEVALSNAKRDASGDEQRTITAVNAVNHTITLDSPLAQDHHTPRHNKADLTLRLHVINLTRNIIFETIDNPNRTFTEAVDDGAAGTATEFSRRGHIMIMHSNNADIRYARFEEMGRTNKHENTLQSADITMPGPVVNSPAANPIARYPLHFHRAGSSSTPAIVEGCVVWGSPGWGFVNHSSTVSIRNNVAYEVDGGAFISEAGDEAGDFTNNIALKMHGKLYAGENVNARPERFANNGVGFWIQSKMVRVRNNIASGFYDCGIQLWNEPIDDVSDDFSEQTDAKFASDPELEDTATVNSDRSFLIENTTVYGGYRGIKIAFGNNGHTKPLPHDFWNQVKDLTAYAVNDAIFKKYSNKFAFINYIAIGDIDNPKGIICRSHVNSSGFNWINCHFEGFEQGLQNASKTNASGIFGGYFNNVINFDMRKFHMRWTAFLIAGAIEFGDLSSAALNGRTQIDFDGTAVYSQEDDLSIGNPNNYIMDIDGTGGPYQSYLETEQDASYIPFATGSGWETRVPGAMVDQTNTQLLAFPNSYAQAILPGTAIEVPGFSYGNVLHEPITSVPFNVKVFRNNTLPNLILPTGTLQTVIDLSGVFIDPLGEAINYTINTNTNPGLITASLSGATLTLDYDGVSTGTGIIRITGTSATRGTSAIDGFSLEITGSMPALPPLSSADAYPLNQDTVLNEPAVSGVLANDTEPNSEAMIAQIEQRPANGSIILNADGSFDYTPNATFSGADTFIYRALDINGELSDFTTVTINVASTTNDAPTANDDSSSFYSIFQGDPLNVSRAIDGVIANDTDPEGQTITINSYTQPLNGTLTLNNDGTFDYTSHASFRGQDTFTYNVTDGTTPSNTATVTINVIGPDPVDLFVEDWETGTARAADVPTNPNDWDDPNNPGTSSFSFHGGSQNTLGGGSFIGRLKNANTPKLMEVSFSTAGHENISIQYQRATQYLVAPDYFTSSWSDDGGSNWYTLETSNEIGSLLTNGMSLAIGTDYIVTSDGVNIDYSTMGGPVSGILGDTFTATTTGPVPAGGELDESPQPLDEDGTLDWAEVSFSLPASADNNPNMMLRFEISSNRNTERGDTDNIKVIGAVINSAPTAVNDGIYTTDEDVPVIITDPNLGVIDNDTDPETDPLTASIETSPSNGSVSLNADGTFTYIPDPDFNGTDSFTYRANDLLRSSPPATVSITVNAVNDSPVPDNDSAIVPMNSPGVIIDVLANDSDVDGDGLIVASVDDPTNGTVVINGDNTITYTPDGGFTGPTETFTYYMNDGVSANKPALVTVTISGNGFANYMAGYPGVGGLNGETDDPDGDGMTNFVEYSLKADPTSADLNANMPTITINGSNFDFRFYRGQTAVTYQIEKSTDLSTWSNHGAANPGFVDTYVTVQVPMTEMAGGKLFLRLNVSE